MSKKATVLIADDHALSSNGLQQLLSQQRDFDVLEAVENGFDAVAMARLHKPNLAILDYAMPGLNGAEAMQEIRKWSPDTRVAILTGNTSNAVLSTLLLANVDGLFMKTTHPDDIVFGLRKALTGEQVIGPGIADINAACILTAREHQVLKCIAEGLANPATAERLSISVKTVESHRMSIMRKLNVHSVASLLVRAMRDGLIDP